MRRDKYEKVAFAKFLAALLQPLLQHSDEALRVIIADYAEEILQLKYNYKYTPVRVEAMQEKVEKHKEIQRLMDRVAALTVTDE